MSVKVKKGDLVFINCGKDKGKTGKVTKVLTKKNKLFVEGINMVKKHTKPSGNNKGGIENVEMPVNISNVSHLDPKDNKPTKVGFKTLKDGKKVRFFKRSGETIG
tara:strand:+ start:585 stop:899 length:315 start_codon:yes stop_codon:yes gene_type:complete